MFRKAVLLMALILASPMWAQDGAKKKPYELMLGDLERLNEEMVPGPMHQLLASLEGEWTYESTTWMLPDAPPTLSQGEATKRSILGGRFLEEVHRGELLGSPFEGRSLTGWDNRAKEFQAVWVDNFGTGILMSHGRLEADGKTIALEADHVNLLTSRREKLRLITRIVDADHHVFEYWAKPAGRPEYQQMEVRFSRKGKS